tara:strand:+ start:671 stop:1273 length:603 start_codon:yes stop_codon:yes gene_type:complete
MNNKKVYQYSLLVLLFVTSFLFYYVYFFDDVKKIESNKSKNISQEKDPVIIQKDLDKNIIENLKYVSEDLLGNTYTVIAESATFKEDRLNEVQLFEVNAQISKQNTETIYIYSKTANYNKINNNTVFKEKVNVRYGDQTIDSEILNLNFKDNLIEILDNVYYVNKNTRISADIVEIDLLYKNLKVSMINKKDKVNIISKQ